MRTKKSIQTILPIYSEFSVFPEDGYSSIVFQANEQNLLDIQLAVATELKNLNASKDTYATQPAPSP